MKFHQLAIGQHFEFEGKVYVRTKPLTAVDEENGRQRFIRRSATVKVVSAEPPPTEEKPSLPDRLLEPEAVLEAFDVFYASCLESLEAIEDESGTERAEIARGDIKQARRRFLETLSL